MDKISQDNFAAEIKDFSQKGNFDKLLNGADLKEDAVELVSAKKSAPDNLQIEAAIKKYLDKLNGAIELSKKGAPQRKGDTSREAYNSLRKGDVVRVQFRDFINGEQQIDLVVTKEATKVGRSRSERVMLKRPDNLKGMKYFFYNRPNGISFATGDMATTLRGFDIIKKKDNYTTRRNAKGEIESIINWEEKLIGKIQKEFMRGRRDATAMKQSKKAEVKKAWNDGLTASETFDKLFKPSPKPKPKPSPKPSPTFDKLKTDILKGKYKNATKKEIIKIAQSWNEKRRPESIRVDNSRDNSKRIEATPENLVRWVKSPGKFDFIGADNYKESNVTVTFKMKKEQFWKRLLNK